MSECWDCGGRKWVSDGDMEDGMMTGRMTCPTCRGTGLVSLDQMLAAIERILRGRSVVEAYADEHF